MKHITSIYLYTFTTRLKFVKTENRTFNVVHRTLYASVTHKMYIRTVYVGNILYSCNVFKG